MLQELLFIVFVFISLAAGIGSILLVNRLSKTYRSNYLNTYLYKQLLGFIFGLYGLISMAVVKWILQEMDTSESTIETIANFIPYLGIPFLIAAWYMFIKLSAELVGRKVLSGLTFSYFTFMLLTILGYGYLIYYLFQSESENAQYISDLARYFFAGLEIATLLLAFYFLYIGGMSIRHRSFRKAIQGFAHIYLLVSLARITLFFLSAQNMIFGATYILVFFAGDIPAILYLGAYLNRHYLTTSEEASKLTPYLDFISNYHISKREWEIIQRINEGLTNRQISETLFISLQTVKDHTHRIYKKTGVKNRVQLVKMINDVERRQVIVQA